MASPGYACMYPGVLRQRNQGRSSSSQTAAARGTWPTHIYFSTAAFDFVIAVSTIKPQLQNSHDHAARPRLPSSPICCSINMERYLFWSPTTMTRPRKAEDIDSMMRIRTERTLHHLDPGRLPCTGTFGTAKARFDEIEGLRPRARSARFMRPSSPLAAREGGGDQQLGWRVWYVPAGHLFCGWIAAPPTG